MTKHHVKLAIGIGVILSALGYLMFSGTTGSTVYFLTVPEIQQRATTLQGTPLRVAGKVTEEPIAWDMRTLALAFVMGDGNARIPVHYKGVKPDMFRPGADVIVEGHLNHQGIFVASNLMTSCPSKYQEEKGSTL